MEGDWTTERDSARHRQSPALPAHLRRDFLARPRYAFAFVVLPLPATKVEELSEAAVRPYLSVCLFTVRMSKTMRFIKAKFHYAS